MRNPAARLGLSVLVVDLMLFVCGARPAQGQACPDEKGKPLPLAADSLRVDRGTPVFSRSTRGTNPLFPVDQITSYIQLGQVGGKPFRVEVTLLPATREIAWLGRRIPVVQSQYLAFIDGRIEEAAVDLYAQADDGAVWYLGEEVYNYVDGKVEDREGTWLAGRDGPGAMIMPAMPKVGDAFRTENICGLVFEEVTVKATNVIVPGPTGPVAGAVVVSELHQDALREDKIFAPGYGEFSTGLPGDLEAIAVAVPTDALAGAPPAALDSLATATARLFDAAGAGAWTRAAVALREIDSSWARFRDSGTPPMLATQMTDALALLTSAVGSHQAGPSRHAAIVVARAAHDFRLRHRPPVEIDRARFELWARQLLVDAAARDHAAVLGDVAVLEWTRDRILHTLRSADQARLNALLARLKRAAAGRDLNAASQGANDLRSLLRTA